MLGAESFDTIYYNPVEFTYFTGKNIIKIFCKSVHVMFLSSNNKLYGCGYNSYGQLGLGANGNRNRKVTPPEEVSFFNNINIKDVSTGSTHTLVLTEEGSVYGFGYDGKGELGRGNTNNVGHFDPGLATILSSYNVSYIHGGYQRSFFITTDNKVYSVGMGNYGQLGNGHFQNKTELQHISFFDTINIIKIVSGTYHTLFLSENGNVYSVGANSSGQLGIGTKTPESPYGLSSVQTIGSAINDIFADRYHSYYIQ
jgi:alpha-tubulin suppressor-like RCC1 family protein